MWWRSRSRLSSICTNWHVCLYGIRFESNYNAHSIWGKWQLFETTKRQNVSPRWCGLSRTAFGALLVTEHDQVAQWHVLRVYLPSVTCLRVSGCTMKNEEVKNSQQTSDKITTKERKNSTPYETQREENEIYCESQCYQFNFGLAFYGNTSSTLNVFSIALFSFSSLLMCIARRFPVYVD